MTREPPSAPYLPVAWAAFASSAVAAVGMICLVLLYVGLGLRIESLRLFGPLNDVCVVLQYVAALPVVVAFHRLLAPRSPGAMRLATLAAIVGIVGTAGFQYLLITGRMAFVDQVGYVSVTVLLIGVWIVTTGVLGRRHGVLPFSARLVFLAALSFGFPVWMYRVGRLFARQQRTA